MKTALQLFQEKGIPESVYADLDVKAQNKLAKTIDKTFVAPPADPIIGFELKVHTPKEGKNKGKVSVYLSGQVEGAYGGIFHFLNHGEKLNAEGRKTLGELLTTAAQSAASLLESV